MQNAQNDMDTELPKPLILLNASLSREAVSLAVLSQLQHALRQAQSGLSFIRQDAYIQISNLLEGHLTSDPTQAGPVFEALLQASCWDVILRSLRAGLTCGGEGSSPTSASPHATAEQELVALLSVVQATCMIHPAAKQSVCGDGIVQLLLQRLPAAQPALACACLDTLLSLQLNYTPAFQLLVELHGMQQVSNLIQSPSTPDKVRTWGARFLNLTLTHIAPSLIALQTLEVPDGKDGAVTVTGSTGGGAAGAGVEQSLEAARRGVEEVLGRDAAALLMRKVNLQERQAESKLEQLSQALSFFLQQ